MSEPSAGAPYKDRSAGLVLFGVLELLLAVGCLGMLVLATFSLALAPSQPGGIVPVRSLLPSLGIYLLLAAFFGVMGMGSILARRWARSLLLVASWLWLIGGVMSLLVFIFVLPDLFERIFRMQAEMQAQTQGKADPQLAEVMGVARGCTVVFLALFFAVLPGIFITFYGSRHVRATVEARDPVPRWTDRCPTPVLALAIVLGYCAFSSLSTAALGAFPVFGQVLTGLPALVLLLALAAMLAVLSWAVYRLEPWAWWAVLGFWALGSLSAVSFTLGGFDWRAFYGAMSLPTQEIEKLGIFESLQGPAMKALVLAWVAATLGYLVWIRRFFRRPEAPAAPPELDA